MKRILLLGSCLISLVTAISLDVDDEASIRRAAKIVAADLMEWYSGDEPGGTPGILPQPYYWWEAGAMWGALIDYWYYTNDSMYNDILIEGMVHQASPTRDFMPPNQTKAEGNDDQAFWGMAAMSAAEVAFPNPPSDQPQWLALAQGVFNSQAARWETGTCGGGLKWQIFDFNNGYHYKNTISQGGLFNIAARLGAYTKNETYFEWADRVWEWTDGIGLINDQYQVFDGTDSRIGCTRLDHTEWSYNNGIMLHGAAVMWNQTTSSEQEKWASRIRGLLRRQQVFFTGPNKDVMIEVACERNRPEAYCNNDQACYLLLKRRDGKPLLTVVQVSFKAYLSRWNAATSKLVPWTYNITKPYLRSSAIAAAQSCSGGDDGTTCGNKWWVEGWDGVYGPGVQLSALEVIQSNLIERVKGVVAHDTGGTSEGDVTAGTEGDVTLNPWTPPKEVTTADKAGAGFITAMMCILTAGGSWWMIS